MAEYIDRKALAMRVLGLTIVDPMVANYADAVLFQIQQVPAADVVEVVRCKDCKYSGMYCFGTEKQARLACLDVEEDGFIRAATSVTENDFCSYGEKR